MGEKKLEKHIEDNKTVETSKTKTTEDKTKEGNVKKKTKVFLSLKDSVAEKKEVENSSEKTNKSNKKIVEQLQEECIFLKEENKVLKTKIQQLQDNFDELSQALSVNKKRNSVLLLNIEELKQEIIKREEVLKIFQSSAKKSQNELLDAIAQSLKLEYEDFKTVENVEMNIDLGENMRCQINNIFKILSKYGINVIQ